MLAHMLIGNRASSSSSRTRFYTLCSRRGYSPQSFSASSCLPTSLCGHCCHRFSSSSCSTQQVVPGSTPYSSSWEKGPRSSHYSSSPSWWFVHPLISNTHILQALTFIPLGRVPSRRLRRRPHLQRLRRPRSQTSPRQRRFPQRPRTPPRQAHTLICLCALFVPPDR